MTTNAIAAPSVREEDEAGLWVESVSVTFGQGSRQTRALSETSLAVRPGEIVCLIGPSGCGKSTVLNVISGLINEYEGQVHVGGKPLSLPNRRIGYMFQQDALFPWLTVTENIIMPMKVAGVPRAERQERTKELIGTVQLDGFERHYPHQLSGGMRKRVQLARLLAQDPAYLLLDEPFGALDAQTRLIMQKEFLDIWARRGKPGSLFVTHDLVEAIEMGDRILVFSRRPGRIRAEYHVDLPRSRTVTSMMGSHEYETLFASLWADLEEEARLSMAASPGGDES